MPLSSGFLAHPRIRQRISARSSGEDWPSTHILYVIHDARNRARRHAAKPDSPSGIVFRKKARASECCSGNCPDCCRSFSMIAHSARIKSTCCTNTRGPHHGLSLYGIAGLPFPIPNPGQGSGASTVRSICMLRQMLLTVSRNAIHAHKSIGNSIVRDEHQFSVGACSQISTAQGTDDQIPGVLSEVSWREKRQGCHTEFSQPLVRGDLQ